MYNYTAIYNSDRQINFVASSTTVTESGQILAFIDTDIIAIFPATTILTRQGKAETA